MQYFVFLVLLFGRTSTAKFFEIKSHTENYFNYDITTILKIPDTSDNNCEFPFIKNVATYTDKHGCHELVGKIHLRTNAIGLPIEYDGQLLYSGKKALEFIVDSSYPSGTITKNDVEYNTCWEVKNEDTNENINDNENDFEPFNNMRSYSKSKGTLQSQFQYQSNTYPFKISWVQDKSIEGCVSITYKYSNIASGEMFTTQIVDITDNTEQTELYHLENTVEFKTAIIRTNKLFLKDHSYYLKINNIFNGRIEIKRIAQCIASNEDEEVYEIIIPRTKINQMRIKATQDFNSINEKSENGNLVSIYQGQNLISSSSLFMASNNTYLQNKECDVNEYGADCSGICSTKNTYCKNMIFCSRFGCSCASGYFGTHCNQECGHGFYGQNCLNSCPQSCELCNIYTGMCIGSCKKNYILPKCNEKYPWIVEPPNLILSDYHSITLDIHFEIYENADYINNHELSGMNPLLYQIIHKKAASDDVFQYSDFEVVNNSNKTITIDNLQFGTIYTFGVILITNDGNYNDEDLITVNYTTLCNDPRSVNYGVVYTSGINSINVTWKKHKSTIPKECKITKYLLELSYGSNFDIQSKIVEQFFTETDEHVFENLISGHTYVFRITAFTVLGSTELSEIKEISTLSDGIVYIKNIMVDSITSNSLQLTWDQNALITVPINYLIKYKVNKYFSCTNNVMDNWTHISVYNISRYYFKDLVPNSQYVFKLESVTKNYTYGQDENMIYARTPFTKPQITPVLDNKYPVYVTNESVIIKWFVNKTDCIKFNGFHRGFELVLADKKDNTKIRKETKDFVAEFNNLNPNTDYELLVYIKNNVGYNEDYALIVPFKTKSKFLPPVEDLTIYKKNIKTRSAGLRWSYSDQFGMDQFIITLSTNNPINVKETAVEPFKCSAWPEMYCATIDNLIPGTENTVKVKAKSIDYPTGGLPASANFNTMDGPPDEPTEVRAKIINSDNVTLDWDIPWMLNGALNSFVINVEEVSAVDINLCCASFPIIEVKITEENPTYNYTINNLKPGSTYAIGVMAKTSWYGQAKRIYVTTLL